MSQDHVVQRDQQFCHIKNGNTLTGKFIIKNENTLSGKFIQEANLSVDSRAGVIGDVRLKKEESAICRMP